MKFKAIIFDMDGTIIDTSSIWRQATIDLVNSKGGISCPDTFARLEEKFHGLALRETCTIIKETMNLEDEVRHLIDQKLKIARELHKKHLKFIEGFQDFHKKVVAKGLKHGIATNADDSTLALSCEILLLNNFFGEHVYGISYVDNICKPHPAIYLYVANKLGVNPSECIAIEDSAHGIKSAQAAGMFCIGLNTLKNYNQVKEADLIVESYYDIDLDKIL